MACEERTRLRDQLEGAFAEWYDVKDVPGKGRESKKAEEKVHHIQRALGDHIAKHRCNP
jgi:hypothetical protein